MKHEKQIISPENFKKIIFAVYGFRKLPINWNKHGALQVELSAIKRAIRFLHALLEELVLKEVEQKFFYITDLPSDEEIQEIIKEGKEEQIKYLNDPNNTGYFWNHLQTHITPYISYWAMDIRPTFEGGIEFRFGSLVTAVYVTIPPDERLKISYQIDYIPLSGIEPTETKKATTYDYKKIARCVYKLYV